MVSKDQPQYSRNVITLLGRLGLSRNEAKCYLAALTNSPASVSVLAHQAHIPRVNAYAVLGKLLQRGLVERESAPRGAARYHVAPPDHLRTLAEDRQRQAAQVRWRVENILPALAAMGGVGEAASALTMGDITFYRGEDAFYQISERTLTASADSTMCFLESFDYFDADYDDKYYIPRRLKKNIKARVLHVPDQYAKSLQKNDAITKRVTRLLPPEIHFPCSMYLYDSEAAFLWTAEHVVGLVVRGGPLVKLMQAMFEMIWEISNGNVK